LVQPTQVITVDIHADVDPQVFDRVSAKFLGVPCPFLTNGACSIYRYRPLACRHQISLANDDSHCRLEGEKDKDVPYLNRFDAKVAYVIAMGHNSGYADLREWFSARE